MPLKPSLFCDDESISLNFSSKLVYLDNVVVVNPWLNIGLAESWINTMRRYWFIQYEPHDKNQPFTNTTPPN